MPFGTIDNSGLDRINSLIAAVGQKHIQNLEASKTQEIRTKQKSDAEKWIDMYNSSRTKNTAQTQPAGQDNANVAQPNTSYREDYIRTSVQPAVGRTQMNRGGAINTSGVESSLQRIKDTQNVDDFREAVGEGETLSENEETNIATQKAYNASEQAKNDFSDQYKYTDEEIAEQQKIPAQRSAKVEVDGGKTLPVQQPKIEGNVGNDDEAYTTAYTNLMKMGDNPFAQQAIKQLESLHETRTKGRLTEKDKVDIGFKQDESKRNWEKLDRDTRESDQKISIEQRKLDEMISNNDDKNEISKQRIQVIKERQNAREHLEDIFDYDANGNRTLKQGVRSTDITRVRVNTGNLLRGYVKDRVTLLKAVENQDITKEEAEQDLSIIGGEIENLQDMNRALNGRPVNTNEKYNSQDDFIRDFEKEYNRKPSDSELEKAKGKYF